MQNFSPTPLGVPEIQSIQFQKISLVVLRVILVQNFITQERKTSTRHFIYQNRCSFCTLFIKTIFRTPTRLKIQKNWKKTIFDVSALRSQLQKITHSDFSKNLYFYSIKPHLPYNKKLQRQYFSLWHFLVLKKYQNMQKIHISLLFSLIFQKPLAIYTIFIK